MSADETPFPSLARGIEQAAAGRTRPRDDLLALHDLDDVAAEFGVDLRPDLTEFLLTRIAEDEASEWADLPEWRHGHRVPNRFVRECEAKRRIVKELRAFVPQSLGGIGGTGTSQAVRIMEALAMPYADHPDYREEWKP